MKPEGLIIGTDHLRGEPFALPLDAVTRTFGILAQKGSGKSYASDVMAEEMLKAGQRICIMDPTNAHYGLRSSASGKGEGYPIVVFGGPEADVPLTEAAADRLAELAAAPGPSMILDMSDLRKAAKKRFAANFFEHLYDLKSRAREPLHLFVDEADEFAPQRVMGDDARMVGAIEDIVRRGRIRGLGTTLITQRSSVINWDVLSQVDTLIALRTTGPLDVERMRDWVKYHADQETAKQAVADLSTLPTGMAWIWSPGWLRRLEKVQIRKRETFDSGKTPEPGAVIAAPTKRAKIDIAAITAEIEALVIEAEANSPATLKKRIAVLERELAAKPKAPEPVIQRVEVPVLTPEQADALGEHAEELRRYSAALATDIGTLLSRLASLRITPADTIEPTRADNRARLTPNVSPAVLAAAERNGAPLREAVQRRTAGQAREAAQAREAGWPEALKLGKAERAILTVLAQWPTGRTQQQVALISGYSATSGGFRNSVGALRGAGLIAGTRDKLWITEAGQMEVGVEPAPTGPELAAMWQRHPALGKAERAILATLVEHYPAVLSSAAIATLTDYQPTSGGFRNSLGKLRTLGLIEGPNAGMIASADLT